MDNNSSGVVYCDVVAVGEKTLQCKVCGRKYRATSPQGRLLAECKAAKTAKLKPKDGCCGERLAAKTCHPVQVAGTVRNVTRCAYCGKLNATTGDTCLGGDQPLGTNEMRSPLARAIKFSFAKAKHFASGSPELELPQITERFSYCSICPHYNPTVGACSLCGCLVNLNAANEGWNALAWADKHCPDQPPKF